MSNRGYSRFRNLNIVGYVHKKRLTKGGSRAPQDRPPPSHALALKGHCFSFKNCSLIIFPKNVYAPMFRSVFALHFNMLHIL